MGYQRQSLGHGIGLRPKHFSQLLAARPQVAWLEAVSENYLAKGGRPVAVLEKVRRDVPVALHGVSLSIGAAEPLNQDYLEALAALVARIEPVIVSDHLCWGSHGGRYGHDLWPLPYTAEAVDHVAGRIGRVQDRLQRQILIENVSSYVSYRESEMPEWEFVRRIAEKADCGILLDINNIYVNAVNHGIDAADYLAGIPVAAVREMHLAGHEETDDCLIDTHSRKIADPVWRLFADAVRLFGPCPALIEWDTDIPSLAVLLTEAATADQILAGAAHATAAA